MCMTLHTKIRSPLLTVYDTLKKKVLWAWNTS